VDVHGYPSARRLTHFAVLDAEEARNARAGQVDVEDADSVALEREGEGELGGDAALADPALAREDEHNIFDVIQRHIRRSVRGVVWRVIRGVCG
jgi:hypothetical protein